MEHDSFEFDIYLYKATNAIPEWEVYADEDDNDNDGLADHFQLTVLFKYENLAPSDVELSITVFRNGEYVEEQHFSTFFEGWGDFEESFDFYSIII